MQTYFSTGIHHAAIVATIAGFADALIDTRQIFAFTVSAIDLQGFALVHVNGTIWTCVSGALAVARIVVHPVVTSAVVFTRYFTLGIWCAIIDVYFAIHTGETGDASASWRLFYAIT